jgi:hypothetical protein
MDRQATDGLDGLQNSPAISDILPERARGAEPGVAANPTLLRRSEHRATADGPQQDRRRPGVRRMARPRQPAVAKRRQRTGIEMGMSDDDLTALPAILPLGLRTLAEKAPPQISAIAFDGLSILAIVTPGKLRPVGFDRRQFSEKIAEGRDVIWHPDDFPEGGLRLWNLADLRWNYGNALAQSLPLLQRPGKPLAHN